MVYAELEIGGFRGVAASAKEQADMSPGLAFLHIQPVTTAHHRAPGIGG